VQEVASYLAIGERETFQLNRVGYFLKSTMAYFG
jgi:hypothetical protein